jgi:xanthine dehydrogenase accessory factor
MNNWAKQLSTLMDRREPCVLITILTTKGSTPREVGAKMLISEQQIYLSIGGGHLEHQVIKKSKETLQCKQTKPFVHSFSLGASLGQCCGGQIDILFEPCYPPAQNIAIFGAGHIANALVPILSQLPCSVQWIDSRAEMFPVEIAENTQCFTDEDVTLLCEKIPDDSYVLIMTHNHQIDQAICEQLLRQNNSAFIGLVGSTTKWRKFTLRLSRKGFSDKQINRINCPIGTPYVSGKLPIEIAVSVSAHFINFYQNQQESNLTLVRSTDTHISAN